MDREIQEAIANMSGNQLSDRVQTIDAAIVSVDEKSRTCVVEAVSGSASIRIPDVRLMASVDDGLLIVPAIDSNVTIITSTYTEPYVSSYSEVERIILMGGELFGLLKLLPTLKALNAIEDDIKALKNVFSGWTPVPNDGGASLKTASASWYGSQLARTLRKDIENTKITQGQ